jgi:hypothetical protein
MMIFDGLSYQDGGARWRIGSRTWTMSATGPRLADGERILIARTCTALAAASTLGGFVLSSGSSCAGAHATHRVRCSSRRTG